MPCPPDCQSQIDDLRQQLDDLRQQLQELKDPTLKDMNETLQRVNQYAALFFGSVNANGDLARFNLPRRFTFTNSATGEFTLDFAQTEVGNQMADAIVVAGIVSPGEPAIIMAGNKPSDPGNAILFQLRHLTTGGAAFAPFRFIILLPRS